jgi:YbgC/YbaW family acyl-CoA thioester hydrolase
MSYISVFQDAIKVDIQTRFVDFDMGQHLNNSSYLNYIEIARVEGFTKAMKVDTTKEIGVAANVSIDFMRPIRYGTPVSVLMRIKDIKGSSKQLYFEFVDSNDTSKVYAKAKMIQILFDTSTQKPIPVNDYIRSYANELENNKESDSVMNYISIQDRINETS